MTAGDATLVVNPAGRWWLVEILEQGVPAHYTVFNAASGTPVGEDEAADVAKASDRFSALKHLPQALERPVEQPSGPPRFQVARVAAGDAWDDLRPARPADFVGRDDVLSQILQFVGSVQSGETNTRTFAVQGPSGWGKSSLMLKVVDLASKGRRIGNCSVTAVDSRSATNLAFVGGAIRTALQDAAKAGHLSKGFSPTITSLTHPLDSPDVTRAFDELRERSAVTVLIFDQFEELFAKEPLYGTFSAIRELSLDLDSKQAPLILGFAWKTDISLPQQHPAYHLWHELRDRRLDIPIRRFGTGDIARLLTRAGKEIGVKLNPALRGRLTDQCQGYPWLLKKLLVHVSKKLRAKTSQFALLERELDIQELFREDLADLTADQDKCLRYVADHSPVLMSEVNEHFSTETVNSLLGRRLLVRSGPNYVVYWDIFRDYLTDERVPQIPWGRTFQRDPGTAIKALQAVEKHQRASAGQVGNELGLNARGCVNVLSDLIALQLVDRIDDDQYILAPHVTSTDPIRVGEHVHGQFARHVVCRELAKLDRDTPIPSRELDAIVKRSKPSDNELTEDTIHQQANNLRRWLVFAGHLEERGPHVYRPHGARGSQLGVIRSHRSKQKQFLGSGTSDAMTRLLGRLHAAKQGVAETELVKDGLRNAVYDALALELGDRLPDGRIALRKRHLDLKTLTDAAKAAVRVQPVIRLIADAIDTDEGISNATLGERIKAALQSDWKPASALRYANRLRGFYTWAKS